MKTYEEKQLYKLLKQLSKGYMTQKQIVEKYGQYIFDIALSKYITPNDKRHQPFLNTKGIYEFHDSDRYSLSFKGINELNSLEYLYKEVQTDRIIKIAAIVISLISLIVTLYNSFKPQEIQPELKSYIKSEIANAINDKKNGNVF